MYKRKQFQITVRDAGITQTQTVTGQVTGNYGYHKVDNEYIPTYIPNGMALPIPSPVWNHCKTAAQAKMVIQVFRDFFGYTIPTEKRYSTYFGVDIDFISIPPDKEKQLKEKLSEIFK
jgi:hypothetical protein